MTGSSKSREGWYKEAFGGDYLERYAHRDNDEARQVVDLLVNLGILTDQTRVFDLCCGAGRHLAQMTDKSAFSLGGDLSRDLLLHAKKRNLQVARLDMRSIPLANATMDVVTNFFTAFGYFEEDDENLGVFSEVARVLRPGGWFLFDFLNAGVIQRDFDKKGHEWEEIVEDGAGDRWQVIRRLTRSGRVEKEQWSVEDGVRGERVTESVRLFTEGELIRGLGERGLIVQKRFGNYDGASFDTGSSPRLILLAQRQ